MKPLHRDKARNTTYTLSLSLYNIIGPYKYTYSKYRGGSVPPSLTKKLNWGQLLKWLFYYLKDKPEKVKKIFQKCLANCHVLLGELSLRFILPQKRKLYLILFFLREMMGNHPKGETKDKHQIYINHPSQKGAVMS